MESCHLKTTLGKNTLLLPSAIYEIIKYGYVRYVILAETCDFGKSPCTSLPKLLEYTGCGTLIIPVVYLYINYG